MMTGYDDGYSRCACFWGKSPGSLVKLLPNYISDFNQCRVLDVGCGEGKNAAYLANLGAHVRAVDASELALANARKAWGGSLGSHCVWEHGFVENIELPDNYYNIVIAYGLLHCLEGKASVARVVKALQQSTTTGGIHAIVAFNDRCQDLSAHPGFFPCLCDHSFYSDLYRDWEILIVSDTDLHETHPHNNIPHKHSMTRILARRP